MAQTVLSARRRKVRVYIASDYSKRVGTRMLNNASVALRDNSCLAGFLRVFCCALIATAAVSAPTSTSSIGLTSSPNPSLIGQPVTLTATVPIGATGQVTFYDGATMLGASVIAGAQASFSTRLRRPAGVACARITAAMPLT